MTMPKTLFLYLAISLNIIYIYAGEQPIKMIEEPSNYGMNFGDRGFGGPIVQVLKLRIDPANFSGPPHLKYLYGKCYTYTDSRYKYELCPFNNATQHEQSYHWNPYSGILGVWQEWEISNNTFKAMVMREGDKCRDKFRSAKVLFHCSNQTLLVNVTEPSVCEYHMTLNTPGVCHTDSMLVYPYLSRALQLEWNHRLGQRQAEILTEKGYETKVHDIFVKAGFCLSATQKDSLSAAAQQTDKEKKEAQKPEFESLAKCTEEFKDLKARVKNLEEILDKHGISHNDVDDSPNLHDTANYDDYDKHYEDL